MNLRRLKHTLLRLSLEEKVIGLGSLVSMVGCFLPWYSTKNIVDNKVLSEYGLSGDLGVVGFVIFLMSLLGLLAMVSENLQLPFPKFGYKREGVVFFFMGQAAFLTLLTMAIYTKRSLDFTDADLRFGIYLVLTSSFLSALAAFALIRKIRQKQRMNSFDLDQVEEEEEIMVLNEDPEETMNFEEDKEIMDEIDEAFEEKSAPASIEGEIKVEEVPKSMETEKKEQVIDPNQSNYFQREAGIPEKKEQAGGLGNNFYQDK